LGNAVWMRINALDSARHAEHYKGKGEEATTREGEAGEATTRVKGDNTEKGRGHDKGKRRAGMASFRVEKRLFSQKLAQIFVKKASIGRFFRQKVRLSARKMKGKSRSAG